MGTDGEASVDLINIVSAVAAILSALYAYRSNVIAKKALRLSRQELENKQSNFILYLIEAFRWKQKEGEKKKLLLFNLTINNKSENKNSFKATLEITYLRKDESMAKAVLEHNPDFQNYYP